METKKNWLQIEEKTEKIEQYRFKTLSKANHSRKSQ